MPNLVWFRGRTINHGGNDIKNRFVPLTDFECTVEWYSSWRYRRGMFSQPHASDYRIHYPLGIVLPSEQLERWQRKNIMVVIALSSHVCRKPNVFSFGKWLSLALDYGSNIILILLQTTTGISRNFVRWISVTMKTHLTRQYYAFDIFVKQVNGWKVYFIMCCLTWRINPMTPLRRKHYFVMTRKKSQCWVPMISYFENVCLGNQLEKKSRISLMYMLGWVSMLLCMKWQRNKLKATSLGASEGHPWWTWSQQE